MNTSKRLANIVSVAAITALAFIGCTKNHGGSKPVKIYYVSSALKEDFVFRSGSYWIYRDSLTGALDSAYVSDYTESLESASCVNPSSKREYINMSIHRRNITGSSADSGNERVWMLTLRDDIIKMRTLDDADSVARMQFLMLAKYPFETGTYWGSSGGCAIFGYVDSSYVAVASALSVGSTTYSNAAVSAHTNRKDDGQTHYTDIMYLSAKTGLVKLVIDHPSQGVHHVWELQRYHIQ